MCLKIVNIVALASGVISAAVVGSGVYLFVQKDAILDNLKEQAIESVLGGLGGGALGGAGLGGSLGGDLPIGTPELAPPADQAAAPMQPATGSMGLPVPGGF